MSLIGSPERTERWLRGHWSVIRVRGFVHFLLVKGLLVWGGIMFLLMAILTTFQLGIDHPRLPLVIGIAALLCATGGLFWAAVTWWLNERFFRTLNSEQHP